MSRVISKEEINQWTDKHKITDLKHQKEIRRQVEPKPPVMLKGKQSKTPRPVAQPRNHSTAFNPQRIASILKGVSRDDSASYHHRTLPPSQYREYKESIKKTGTHLIASYAGRDNTDNVKEKLSSSEDIQKIISNKIGDLDLVENEWGVLALTVLGKFLESKFGV
jgi:hypothetical protein